MSDTAAESQAKSLLAQKSPSPESLLSAAVRLIDDKRPMINAIMRRITGDKFDVYEISIAQFKEYLNAQGDEALKKKRAINPKVIEGAKKLLRAILNETPITFAEITKSIGKTVDESNKAAFEEFRRVGESANDLIIKPAGSALSSIALAAAAVALVAIISTRK